MHQNFHTLEILLHCGVIAYFQPIGACPTPPSNPLSHPGQPGACTCAKKHQNLGHSGANAHSGQFGASPSPTPLTIPIYIRIVCILFHCIILYYVTISAVLDLILLCVFRFSIKFRASGDGVTQQMSPDTRVSGRYYFREIIVVQSGITLN